MEKTLVIIKPDGVRQKKIGEIIQRFENKLLRIVDIKMAVMSREVAEEHYAHVKGRDFFEEMMTYITGGPVVYLILEGPEVIKVVRQMIGVTNPLEAHPGTIRGDLGACRSENIVHASDSAEAATIEIQRFFSN